MKSQKSQASVCNFIKKETLAEVFSCQFCEIFKNIFSYRTSPVAAFLNASTATMTLQLSKINVIIKIHYFQIISYRVLEAATPVPESLFVIKLTLTQVFSCEFSEIFKNTFFKNTSGRMLLEYKNKYFQINVPDLCLII